MSKSYHIVIVGVVFLLGLIFGSFFDLQISFAIFSNGNMAGLIIALIGILPTFSMVAIFSGYLFANELTIKHDLFLRILIYLLALAGLGLSIYGFGKEIFSVDGLNIKKLKYLGFIIALVWMCCCGYLGILLGKKYGDANTWKIIFVAFLTAVVALGIVNFGKIIFNRPRFRIAVHANEDYFVNWWQIYKGPKIFSNEEFKSFPSGHTCGAAISTIVLPYLGLLVPAFKKHCVTLFYLGFVITIAVAFSRILVGAHFLSDISMAGLIVVVFFLVNNSFLYKELK